MYSVQSLQYIEYGTRSIASSRMNRLQENLARILSLALQWPSLSMLAEEEKVASPLLIFPSPQPATSMLVFLNAVALCR